MAGPVTIIRFTSAKAITWRAEIERIINLVCQKWIDDSFQVITTLRTRDQARADVFDYIGRFYNPHRRHSTVGYLSPTQFERIKALA